MMRLVLTIGCLSALASCDMPDLAMHGVPARKVTIENSSFSVYVNGKQVEAIRTNLEYGPPAGGIMERGYRAIEKASGCSIVPGSYDGDPARMTAEIECADPPEADG